ncbi:MAG: phage tail tape measure protein [Alphaproteobacteria bacterium]|nr:phage tail tape measure protein [Alphaproteobacteria bacterium]
MEVSLGRSIQAAEKAAQSLENVKKAAGAVGDVGKSLSLKMTAPIVGFGALTLKSAADFEAAMNTLGAISGATGEDLKALERQARDLGETTSFTASQAAEAQTFLAMAGFNTQKIMAAMPGTLQLAAAANLDLGRAADITSNILTGYGKDAAELGHVNNVLVSTFTGSNTTLEMLGDSMKYVAPVAKGAGLAFEETAATIALMGNAGIQGSMAGRSLRMAIAQLLKPTAQTKAALKGLGVSKSDLYDSTGQLKSLSSILKVLADRGANTAQIMAIFGTEAGPAMQAVMDQGIPELEKFTDRLVNVGDVAANVADAQMKGARGGMKKLASAFEGLQLAIADSGLLSAFTDLINTVTSWISAMSKSSPGMFKFLTVLALIVAAVGPVLMVIGQLGMGFYGVSVAIAAFKAMQVASLFLSIAGAVKALGVALLTTPLGLVVAAIAGAVYLLITRFDDFKKGLGAVIGFAKLGLDWLLKKITSIGSAIASVIPDWVKDKMGISVENESTVHAAGPDHGFKSALPSAPSIPGRTEVGGALHIKIDSEGRANVTKLQSNNPNFGLDVDAGLVMNGG